MRTLASDIVSPGPPCHLAFCWWGTTAPGLMHQGPSQRALFRELLHGLSQLIKYSTVSLSGCPSSQCGGLCRMWRICLPMCPHGHLILETSFHDNQTRRPCKSLIRFWWLFLRRFSLICVSLRILGLSLSVLFIQLGESCVGFLEEIGASF